MFWVEEVLFSCSAVQRRQEKTRGAVMLLCCYAVMLLCCYAVMLLCCYAVQRKEAKK